MLILTRKRGEAVVVGDVEIIVDRIRRGSVRLGIKAPKSTPILRYELTTAKERGDDRPENEAA